MIASIPANVYLRQSQQLIRRLALARGYVSWTGSTWSVFSRGNGYRRPLEAVEPWLIEAMRARGHLVERPGGGLLPLSMRQAMSGKPGDHRPLRDESEIPQTNPAESPLAWLRARKLIGDPQFLAGERLRADYERARLERRVTASWEIASPSSAGDFGGVTDSALAARQKFHQALDSVGPELSSILVHVCCLASGIEHAERLLELPQRSGRTVLGLALSALARHYGLLKPPRPERSGSSHWAVAGYRPAIAPSGDS